MKTFDVFLSHSSNDFAEVEPIAIRLRDEGLEPWFDRWELKPGENLHETLQNQIMQIKVVAVFIGEGRPGEWQSLEISAYLDSAVGDPSYTIIPVVLPSVSANTKIPIFLARFLAVDLRRSGSSLKNSDSLQFLIDGIRARKRRIADESLQEGGGVQGRLVSWSAFEQAFYKIRDKVEDLSPDVIVGLADGRVAAAIISMNCNIPELYSIDIPIEFDSEGNRITKIVGQIGDIKGKTVLLIDNHIYTGSNLRAAYKFLKSLRPSKVEKLVLFKGETEGFGTEVNYFALELSGKRKVWPWSLTKNHEIRYALANIGIDSREDSATVGLREVVFLGRSPSLYEISKSVQRILQLDAISPALLAILHHMASCGRVSDIPALYGSLDYSLEPLEKRRLAEATFEIAIGIPKESYRIQDDHVRIQRIPVKDAKMVGKIATLGYSAALDLDVDFEGFSIDSMIGNGTKYTFAPSGKALNVAIGIRKWGFEPLAFGVVGGNTGGAVTQLLERNFVASDNLVVGENETRINLYGIHVGKNDPVKISTPSRPILESERLEIERKIDGFGDQIGTMIISGSFPEGMTPSNFRALLLKLGEKGINVYVDASQPDFVKEALAGGVELLGVNLREFCNAFELDLDEQPGSRANLLEAIRQRLAEGSVRKILVSLGRHGAILCSNEESWFASPPQAKVVSTAGAGDTLKVGMAYGAHMGLSLEESFKLAVAGSAATVTKSGSELCAYDEAVRQVDQVVMERL